MKIFILATAAKQINGELTFFKIDKVSTDRAKVEEYMKTLPMEKVMNLGEKGDVPCYLESSIFETELTD